MNGDVQALEELRERLNKYASLMADESQPTPTVGDLMALRRDFHEMRVRLVGRNESSPDVLRDIAEIDRQADLLDGAIEQALSTEQWEGWLKVTTAWKELEDTYENPASVFYHAVRTNDPSTLPNEFADWLLASPTIERVKILRDRLGDEGFGVIQRSVSERLLGRAETGEYDFRGFPDRFENLDEGFREELFGSHHKGLRDIAAAARMVAPDDHRAKSSKGVQKPVEIGMTIGLLGAAVLEAWKGHPWAAGLTIAVPVLYHAGQYGLAKLMNNPTCVDWLMTTSPKK